MIKGTTTSGFNFEIDENTLNNMEFVDALAEVEENPLMISTVIKMMLSPDQKKRLYDHLRTEDGRVPVEAIGVEMRDIFAVASGESVEIKNS